MNTLNVFLFHSINNMAGQRHILDVVMIFITTYVVYVALILAMGIFFFTSLRSKAVWSKVFFVGREIELGLSVFIGWFIAKILKIIFLIPRPFLVISDMQQLVTESDYSFPSNHAVVSFTIATVVYFYHKRLGMFLYLFAVLVALSRVYVGVHYPFDIVAGAMLGVAIPHVVHWAFSQIAKNKVQ